MPFLYETFIVATPPSACARKRKPSCANNIDSIRCELTFAFRLFSTMSLLLPTMYLEPTNQDSFHLIFVAYTFSTRDFNVGILEKKSEFFSDFSRQIPTIKKEKL